MGDIPPMLPPIADEDASPTVAAVYDDIRATRGSDFVNDFWRVLAHDPALLARTWEDVKAVMAPGALDPLVKEMIYVAVSVTNGCAYCINSHTAAARAKGMTDAMLMELIGVVGMANETNRLVTALQIPVDEAFLASRRAQGGAAGDEAVASPTDGSAATASPKKTGRAKKASAATGGSAARAAKDGADAPKAAASRGRRGTRASDEKAEPQATADKRARTARKARAGANGHDGASGRSPRRRARSVDT